MAKMPMKKKAMDEMMNPKQKKKKPAKGKSKKLPSKAGY